MRWNYLRQVAHSLDDRIVDSVGEDQHADAGVVCISRPAEFLV